MKTISGKKLIQFIVLATIVAIVGYSIVDNLYGSFPTDKGFPLKSVWETKLNDNIRQVIVAESGRILVRLGYSVNSLSIETGELIWKYRTDNPIYSIAAYKNIVYVIGENSIFTLDEESGSRIWQQVIDISSPLNTGIRYIDNNVIVVDDFGYIYILDSQTGETIKHFYVRKGITDTCVYEDKLYTFNGSINVYDLKTGDPMGEDLSNKHPGNTVCENGIAYFSETPSSLFAYDLEKQSIIWSNTFLLPETGIFDVYNLPNFLFIDGVGEFFIVDKVQGKVLHSVPSAGYTVSKTVIGDNLFVFYMH